MQTGQLQHQMEHVFVTIPTHGTQLTSHVFGTVPSSPRLTTQRPPTAPVTVPPPTRGTQPTHPVFGTVPSSATPTTQQPKTALVNVKSLTHGTLPTHPVFGTVPSSATPTTQQPLTAPALATLLMLGMLHPLHVLLTVLLSPMLTLRQVQELLDNVFATFLILGLPLMHLANSTVHLLTTPMLFLLILQAELVFVMHLMDGMLQLRPVRLTARPLTSLHRLVFPPIAHAHAKSDTSGQLST